MMDPSNWGMAGSLVHAMAADGVDLKEAFGLPDQMAPLRLPVPEEQAALARQAPLMAQLRRLAWWLGAGRAVTEDEELASGDAAEAAAELGVDAVRLPHLWWLALDAEFIELDEDETHAGPGESAHAWADGHGGE